MAESWNVNRAKCRLVGENEPVDGLVKAGNDFPELYMEGHREVRHCFYVLLQEAHPCMHSHQKDDGRSTQRNSRCVHDMLWRVRTRAGLMHAAMNGYQVMHILELGLH